jgi:uncharacterized protein (DUF885 family)
MPSPVFEIADRYVDQYAELDPIGATYAGIPGHEDRLPDLGPGGAQARAELDRRTLEALAAVEDQGERDRVARLVMVERLGIGLELHEAGAWRSDLNTIASPLQSVLEVFDLADTSTIEGCEALAARLEAFPTAIAGYRASLEEGRRNGDTVAIRQVRRAVEQTRVRAGHLVELATQAASAAAAVPQALERRLVEAGNAAAGSYEALGSWLESVYAPAAREHDGVGIERYRLAQRAFLGSDPDPAEAYAWGWSEVRRIRDEMTQVAATILPGASLDEVLAFVEDESDFAVHGIEAFRDWAQGHVDHMMDTFGRDHFDIADAIRRCDVRVAPPGGATAAHYTGPSEDGSRPGIYWQPDLGRDRYPLWNQVTTANHEAVPGHHLQVAQVVLGGAEMSRYQRLLAWTSGHGEGWALYAERLCHELGLLDRPEAVLGFLSAAQLRAARVVIDIGVHCGLPIPDDAPFHGGATWTWEVAFDVARRLTGESEGELTSEIDRYFGWPGQAPSYKLGEREWLAARDEARSAAGSGFDLRRFHTAALDLGTVGLDVLRTEVVRAVTSAA